MSSITPCLWFDDDLGEAVDFYTSVFPDGEVHHVTRYGDSGPGEPGSMMAAEWTVNALRFKGVNGGPDHAGFSETISFAVDCADQAEVDRYWAALTADGGEESMCGWLRDRFGLCWQVVPVRLYELLTDPDPGRARAAAGAMFTMRRLVVADLEAAADAVVAG
ncbi:VOC family protein [Nocardioides sp. GXQ0305]|uniref:VOC family protein n=1 Tax=Nocardioides sp. GXQ0305 TaxID=3423912 RepID=UPI003D7DED21